MAYLTSLDAKQFVGGNESARELCDWVASNGGSIRTVESGGAYVDQAPTHGFTGEVQSLVLVTSSGEQHILPGEYLVHGHEGQFYNVQADYFAANYTQEA